MYLSDRAGRYQLLAFDLDASRGPVGEDLAQLRGWLDLAGIPHLVAVSGPGGGRHVWAAIEGGAAAGPVAAVARALAARLPTLDIAPLINSATGCVRPPGAPHRTGGTATVLEGGWGALTSPVATETAVAALLAVVGPAPDRSARPGRAAGTALDEDGHRFLLGPRRALPAASAAALAAPLDPGGDPSAVLWTVLLGAARARWRFADIADLAEMPKVAPGLEHARSARLVPGSPRRSSRPRAQRAAVLTRQWDQAVTFIAACGPDSDQDGADSEYLDRLAAVIGSVRAVQARADASVRRWARRGGPADRRVLDHACVVALTGVRIAVDLDVRSVAMATGIGRETARTALTRLAEDGWLTLATPAEGPRAACWHLLPAMPDPSAGCVEGDVPAGQSLLAGSDKNADPGLSTINLETTRSHVVPPPRLGPRARLAQPPHLPALRLAWVARLSHRLSAQAHDVFTGGPGGLGHAVGAVYAVLEAEAEAAGWAGVERLMEHTGRAAGELTRLLGVLSRARLARVRPRSQGRTWRAGARTHRLAAARAAGVYGVLAGRARRNSLDRAVWAWWLSELEWMHTPAAERPSYTRRGRRHHRRGQPGLGQTLFWLPVPQTPRQQYGPYPRLPGGRADHSAARAALSLGHCRAA